MFSWVGSEEAYVDQIDIRQVGPVVLGRFGGCSTAGQTKNEDGCLVMTGTDWELTVLLDAHNSAESAELVAEQFLMYQERLHQQLEQAAESVLPTFEHIILELLTEDTFRARCETCRGETACLVVVRKGNYVFWLSVGDCIAHLFHPELAGLGQHSLNQRQFFEWIGQVNTFALPVPCYTRGIRELRQGHNRIFLTTDGLVECPGEPFSDATDIGRAFRDTEAQDAVLTLLTTIKHYAVRDSTTILTWSIDVTGDVTQPSNA
ncbi:MULTISPECIES: protein phosphatase 2C domain-containing protein [unclassified Exiguobacterium]|uniref:protein phosphatase 2C domain-containing protein n=1 Tax=unclassified Exiguobacterium TaxID=2644629 RepID=UPI001BEB0FA1|nr:MULTISPECIES: protein phosphatase 2C domain-containing protein [unclassified Exiguobacterium]